MKYVNRVCYNRNSEMGFQKVLLNRVGTYIESVGGNSHATPLMWFKVTLFLSSYCALWSLLAFVPMSMGFTLLTAFMFMWATIFVAFNVSHDAVHGALTGNRKVDDWIFYLTFNLLGPNAYLWRIRHNNAHHFFVNIPGSDMDIDGTDLIRMAPHKPWLPIHRYQHLYASLLYVTFIPHWIFFKDFQILRMKTFGNVTDFNHSWWRILEMIFWKSVYVGYMIVLPSIFLPYSLTTILVSFLLFQFALSFFLLVLFAMSHIAMESHYVEPDLNGNLEHCFYEHQLLTSVDYHSANPIFGFFLGGFNNHVAHHMFPNICSVHYIPITKIIRETAAEHGLPYHDLTAWQLICSHFRILKTLGQGPAEGDQFVVRGDVGVKTS